MAEDAEITVLVQRLFVAHSAAIRGFVASLASDFSLVDDILQETFLTVTAKAAAFEPGSNFKAWAWAIARNKTMEALRKSSREKCLSGDVIEALCAHDQSFDWDNLDKLYRHVSACVEGLSPKARAVVSLRYKQGHRAAEVARQMGWTTNAIHVALSRARRAIRECVQHRLRAEGAVANFPWMPNS